jgi:hypothetical protein
MSAALTGGYDTCLELASSFVELQAEPAVAGLLAPLQGLQVPLLPAAGGPVIAGTVRLILTRADVVAAGDFNDGRVTVRLHGTLGVAFTAPAVDRLGLAAVVTLQALPLVVSPPARRDASTPSTLAVNLSSVAVNVEAQPSSMADLTALAGRLGVPTATVIDGLAETLTAGLAGFVATTSPGNPVFPLGGPSLLFARTGQDGRLGQSTDMTRLTDVTLTTRAATGPHPGVLCVLGDLFDRTAPAGRPQSKTAVATTPPPLTAPLPALSLGIETSTDRKPSTAGTVEIDNKCVHGAFAYQDYTITTVASFAAHPVNLAAPVTYTWTLDGIPLEHPCGTLTATDPAYSMIYSFNADRTALTVLNKPGSPTFNRLIECVATGADGIAARASRGAQFIGSQRVLEPAYAAQLAKCLTALVHALGRPSQQPPPATGSGPITHQDLATLIQRLTPGGEWDPRASDLLQAAVHLAGIPAGDVSTALSLGAAGRTQLG